MSGSPPASGPTGCGRAWSGWPCPRRVRATPQARPAPGHSTGHLAAYAGLAPVTRRSGSSIKGEHPARGGNKRLKNALFLSAFAALHDPESRAYYDRKRAQGKKHNAAIVCLARRRTDVIYAMLRDGTYYQAKTPAAA